MLAGLPEIDLTEATSLSLAVQGALAWPLRRNNRFPGRLTWREKSGR
jgi:hypothetical protein